MIEQRKLNIRLPLWRMFDETSPPWTRGNSGVFPGNNPPRSSVTAPKPTSKPPLPGGNFMNEHDWRNPLVFVSRCSITDNPRAFSAAPLLRGNCRDA